MDKHIIEFYRKRSDDSPQGHFHQVIPLHDAKSVSWREIEEKLPHLCKGWYELARLSSKDRIDFTKEFWLSRLPFHPRYTFSFDSFFQKLDDIGLFIVQKKFDDPYEAHMLYSLKDNGGYFTGRCGATDEEILHFRKEFPEILFPEDYIAFQQIHNGFSKTTDSGIYRLNEMRSRFDQFQALVTTHEGMLTTLDELPIEPQSLIPFYASFGMPFFQCFWSEWYPEGEMGNVYYSEATNSISILASKVASVENMAFPTFVDWLLFYLETID